MPGGDAPGGDAPGGDAPGGDAPGGDGAIDGISRPGVYPVGHGAGQGNWSAPSTVRTRLVLVRHGSTEHSGARAFSGRNALPLNDAGRVQVAGLAARARIGGHDSSFADVAAVVSSPLLRTVQTAQAIAGVLGISPTTHGDLVETDFGAWEGLTAGQIHAAEPGALARWTGSLDVAPPGGESFVQVAERVERARRDLVAQYAGTTVVVVSHVTPIKLLLGAGLDATSAALFRIHLDTASVSIVDFYGDGNASVRLVNDTSHLR